MSSIPTQREIREGGTYNKEINFTSFLNDEIIYFDSLMNASDFDSLVGR